MIKALLHPNSLLFLVTSAGMAVSVLMYRRTRIRERLLRDAGQMTAIAAISIRRTYRTEIGYFLIHLWIFTLALATLWREQSAYADLPLPYEFSVAVGRFLTSLGLLGITLLDLRDARKLTALYTARAAAEGAGPAPNPAGNDAPPR
jgi:hypothetical protein